MSLFPIFFVLRRLFFLAFIGTLSARSLSTMRLTAVAILRKREGAAGAADPLLLGFGADLSTFGFFQRGAVREMLMFVGRTVAKRTEVGCRQVRVCVVSACRRGGVRPARSARRRATTEKKAARKGE